MFPNIIDGGAYIWAVITIVEAISVAFKSADCEIIQLQV